MQLSLRLSAIAELVTEGNRLVDVGCDHGYLPVYLLLNKKIPGAIAMDVRMGPLSRAQEHIARYELSNYIETRLSDGLEKLQPGEGDTLVIAGMGGLLMERILTDGAAVRDTFSELILQPQSDVPHFRKFIRSQGWEIVKENMIFEDGKYYPLMKVMPRPVAEMEEYTPEEEAFGRFLLRENNPVLRQFLKREEGIRQRISENLREASGETAEKRKAEIREEEQLIRTALKRYEGM